MLKTYIGPYHEGVELTVMGESFGVVKPGDSIVIPDEIAEQVDWPSDIWRSGPEKKAASSKDKE
jgi:hypothetical protein